MLYVVLFAILVFGWVFDEELNVLEDGPLALPPPEIE